MHAESTSEVDVPSVALPPVSTHVENKHYSNEGNGPLLELLDSDCRTVLDVGCGAGDNARLSNRLGQNREFFGISLSQTECEAARVSMVNCWHDDIENSSLEYLEGKVFDAVLLSHVLEHLRDPASVLSKFLPYVRPGGLVLIAVPNVLVWRQRLQFLLGRFEYQDDGTMDQTHLRFYSFDSADKYLLKNCPGLKIEAKVGDGSVPLWFLRHSILPAQTKRWLDSAGCALFPNLFAGQTLIKARSES